MTRDLSNVQNEYLANDALISVLLIELTNKTNVVEYYTDAPYDITVNSTTYESTDKLIAISENQETAELTISSVNIVISALATNAITDYATSNMINKSVVIRRAFVDTTTQQLIGDSAGDFSFVLFSGKVSGYQLNNDQTTAEIILEIASQFVDFRKINNRRTNENSWHSANTTSISPNLLPHYEDRIMQFAHESVNDIKWGQP